MTTFNPYVKVQNKAVGSKGNGRLGVGGVPIPPRHTLQIDWNSKVFIGFEKDGTPKFVTVKR